ncbi:hypothetical protein Adu01nite_54250 [Paractinoplanes durhamensis]|uniref:Uncharacterized protein n=1 Tax=Paractinoplanes durhamensis TaxID=113563 RepID=A0ABQ3Z2Q0_9ACTN|nr:hypothetical protein Adu01nite_54250 [Actinoplanes durhamensis]
MPTALGPGDEHRTRFRPAGVDQMFGNGTTLRDAETSLQRRQTNLTTDFERLEPAGDDNFD